MSSEPTEDQRRRDSPPPVEFVRPNEEQAPLPARDQPAAWVPRPEDYRPPDQWTPPARPPPGRSNLPKLAGLLLILAGVVGMAGAIYSALTVSVADYVEFVNSTPPEIVTILSICSLISVWSQALAILGGVMAFQRMNWRLTLVCAVFSTGFSRSRPVLRPGRPLAFGSGSDRRDHRRRPGGMSRRRRGAVSGRARVRRRTRRDRLRPPP